ncbi:MAG: hypothetical protein ABJA86_12425, partial [Nocardioidaceae bacterium]
YRPQSGIMVPMRMSDTDEIAGELYLVPPTRFVAVRDELVRKALTAGSRELAHELQSLRRPTRSAWLVNVLTRYERASMERLSVLGRELREAQTRLDESALRRLSAQRQQMIADLLDRARSRAAEAGLPPAKWVLSEVEETLRAALVDLAASSTVLSGRLVRPMTHIGFGPMPHLNTPAASRGPSPSDEGATTPDVEPEWNFWPVEHERWRWREDTVPEQGAHLHVAPAPSPSLEDQRPRQSEPASQEGEPAVEAVRAQAELTGAESVHWQREQEVAHAEAAAEAARDRLEWLDHQRMEARRERVTTERRLAEAQSAQHASAGAVAEARRVLEAAKSLLRPASEQPLSGRGDD